MGIAKTSRVRHRLCQHRRFVHRPDPHKGFPWKACSDRVQGATRLKVQSKSYVTRRRELSFAEAIQCDGRACVSAREFRRGMARMLARIKTLEEENNRFGRNQSLASQSDVDMLSVASRNELASQWLDAHFALPPFQSSYRPNLSAMREDPSGKFVFLDETLTVPKGTLKQVWEIKELPPYVRGIVGVSCMAMGLDPLKYNISGKKGPRSAPGQYKLRYPEKVLRIADTFFKMRLCADNQEVFCLHFTHEQFQEHCPRAFKDYNDLTRSETGEAKTRLGKFGQWANQAGQ